MKFVPLFFITASFLLLMAAAGKLISSFGNAQILSNPDPILRFSFKSIFLAIGAIELVLASICMLKGKFVLKAGLIAWLATAFFVYRLGLAFVGYHKPCSCLGNLTDALHIQPQVADTAMKVILAYLLIGSYSILFWLWRQKRSQSSYNNSRVQSA